MTNRVAGQRLGPMKNGGMVFGFDLKKVKVPSTRCDSRVSLISADVMNLPKDEVLNLSPQLMHITRLKFQLSSRQLHYWQQHQNTRDIQSSSSATAPNSHRYEEAKFAEGIDGSKVEKVFEAVHIAANKNTVPGDVSAMVPGGIRMGTPALTPRGFVEDDLAKVAHFFDLGVKLALKIKGAAQVNYHGVTMSYNNLGWSIPFGGFGAGSTSLAR